MTGPQHRPVEEKLGKPLSAREREVLVAAAAGDTAAQTGQRFHISPETVELHRTHIRAKLGAANTAHAVALAYEQRILGRPCRHCRWPVV